MVVARMKGDRYARGNDQEKKNDNLKKRKNGFKNTNDVPNQVKLLSGSQKLRVLWLREVSRKNVWPDDDERVAYRSNGVLRLRNSSFHSTHLYLILIAVLLELCHGLSRFFTISLFISFTPLPGHPPHTQGACSAAKPSPGELYSTKRHDLSSDGRFLLHRDIMQPFVQH